MRTRTLLLLAIMCGVVILVAGGAQLIRLTEQEQTATQLDVGEQGQAGDVVVTVRSAASDINGSASLTRIDIEIGGVDDPQGLDGFTLVGVGQVAQVDPATSTCAAIEVGVQRCELAFDTTAFPSGARQLVFRRAETQLRWVLPAA
jgi:hypothetical protein